MHTPENVAFELSNRCNMSAIHPECPTDAHASPIFLKTPIILDVVHHMGLIGWTGNFYLNIYNEPMIDPRLYYICNYIRDNSNANIQIYTNGWYLNEYLFKEMMFLFPNRIGFTVSVYSDSEQERLEAIPGLNVHRIKLDNRKIIYSCDPVAKGPCKAPSIYPMINCKGELALCCLDFKYKHIIADLNKIPFHEALNSIERIQICDDLANGIRTFDTCKRCPHIGWGIPHSEWSKWQ